MEPIAAGFMFSIAAAAFLGVVVGAIGGAVIWRLRKNIFLGGLLTAGAYVLLLIAENEGRRLWIRGELAWGIPALVVSFLLSSLLARLLSTHTRLSPTWTSVATLGLTWVLGFLYLFLFRVSLTAPREVALWADTCLLLLLVVQSRKAHRQHA